MDLRRLDWLLIKAQEAATLTPKELKFVDDMINRRERWGDDIKISEAQEDWLEAIGAKD